MVLDAAHATNPAMLIPAVGMLGTVRRRRFQHSSRQYSTVNALAYTMFFEDKSSIPIELCCGVCAQPWWPETAVACPKCEEIFCRACIEDHLAKSATCPNCHANVDPKDMRPPHRQLKSMAARTPVLCPNRPGECWRGPWGELETHLRACPYDSSKIIFVDEADPDLRCEICHNTLRGPEMCSRCQQLFCGACLRQSLQRESKCPHCRGELVEDVVQDAPRQVKSMLAKLRVSCINNCGWIGPRSEYDVHLPACPLRTAAHAPVAAPHGLPAAAPIVTGLTVGANCDPSRSGLLDATNSKAYIILAKGLPAGETVTLPGGRPMNQRELYLEAIRHDGANSEAYTNLAICLTAGETVTLPDGRPVNQLELYLEAIRHNGTYSRAYINLAACLTAGESVTLPDGRAVDKRKLYLEAIRHNRTYSTAYTNLAACLTVVESVTLPDGRAVDKRKLYLEAIRRDETCSAAYGGLADCLRAGESVTLPDDRAMDKCKLYLEAIRHNGTYSRAYINLANCLPVGESVTLPDGRAMNQRELYFEAIHQDGANSAAYTNLANCLPRFETVTLPDGRAMNQREIHLEVIRRDGTCSAAYDGLANCLTAGETVTLPDNRAMDKRKLYLEAIRHNGTYSRAYINLANCLPAVESVTLPDGRAMSKRELHLEAERVQNYSRCVNQ
jgi:tetratricopeptide (TPR) repeat protein